MSRSFGLKEGEFLGDALLRHAIILLGRKAFGSSVFATSSGDSLLLGAQTGVMLLSPKVTLREFGDRRPGGSAILFQTWLTQLQSVYCLPHWLPSFLTNMAVGQNRCTTRFSLFLGLRPLAGYASLKLYHVMSCFLYEKRILCYDMAG